MVLFLNKSYYRILNYKGQSISFISHVSIAVKVDVGIKKGLK